MGVVSRREFLGKSLGTVAGACAGLGGTRASGAAPGKGERSRRKLRHLGWQVGIPVTIPYMLHTAGDFSDIPRNLRAVHPLPAVGHVCVRSKPFKNYPVPPKTPEVIARFFDAVERTEADNLAGLMFFNESCVSDENRKAVYQGVRRFL